MPSASIREIMEELVAIIQAHTLRAAAVRSAPGPLQSGELQNLADGVLSLLKETINARYAQIPRILTSEESTTKDRLDQSHHNGEDPSPGELRD